jgi:poly(ADP-ribose) glycohydrolase
MAQLPHKDKESWEKTKEKLKDLDPKSITELNTIFFEGKIKFFDEIDKLYTQEGKEFINIFKYLRDLALDLENLMEEEIPLLENDSFESEYKLTRKKVALLFILSFFNLIDTKQFKERETNPFVVFEVLSSTYNTSFQFGHCFLNYLTIIGKWLEEDNKILNEEIKFIRDSKGLSYYKQYEEKKLCDIQIIDKGSLFDGDASYCVDFANMFIGGGALEGGCVQEEILFATHPEAVVSMFFMEVMSENDAIRIDNLIKFSDYEGYSHSFKFSKSAINKDTNLETIKKINIIAIDAAVFFSKKNGIIDSEDIQRDIHKAFVGFNLIFYEREKPIEPKNDNEKGKKAKKDKKIKKEKTKEEKLEEDKNSISTGNWGCGAFNGDHELKFFEQWVSASFAGVQRLDYYTYGNKRMNTIIERLDEIKSIYTNAYELYEALVNKTFVEGEILKILLDDEAKLKKKNKSKGKKCSII